MANKNFEIKNGLTVAGTERITAAGLVTGTTTTQAASDNTTKLASTSYVTTAIANLADSAPSTLNTLNELAAALGDDANYATTTTNAIAAKLPLAGGTLTGSLAITGTTLVSDDQTNDWVKQSVSGTTSTLTFGNTESTAGQAKWEYTRSDGLFKGYIGANAVTNFISVTSAGKIGIGTGSNVDEMLHIEKSSGTTLVKTEVAANSVVGLEIKKTGSTTSNWRIVDGQTVNGNLEIYDVTDSRSVMIVDGDGDIGMGVTPLSNAKLTLGGTATSYSSVLGFDNNTTGGATFFMLASDNTWSAGGDKFLMGHGSPSSSAVDVTIDADGKVGINDTSPSQMLSVSGKSSNVPARFTAAGNTNTLEVFGNSTASTSTGILCNAGTNSNDYSAKFRNHAGSTIMEVRGDSLVDTFGGIRLQDSNILALGQSSDARLYFDSTTNALMITASNGTANTVNITANNFQIGGATPLISGTANDSVVINQDGASNVDFRVESDNEQYNFFCDASSEIIHFGEGTNSDVQSVIPAKTLAGRRHGYHGGNKQHAGQTFKYSEGVGWTDAIKIDWHNVSWGAVCMRITGQYYYSASSNFSIVIGFQGYGEVGSSSYGHNAVSYDATSSGAMTWTSAIQLSQPALGETLIKQRAGDTTGDVIYRYEWQCYARSNQPILIIDL